MNEDLVIALDSSTTGLKVIALTRNGEIRARSHENIPLFSPKSNYYEQNPDDW